MNNEVLTINNDFEVIYEKCVSCDCKTDIPIDRHIDFRPNYVEGVGQLCNECADRIFEK